MGDGYEAVRRARGQEVTPLGVGDQSGKLFTPLLNGQRCGLSLYQHDTLKDDTDACGCEKERV